MKNVAATSGQRVSFAFLFVEVTARGGNWAGRDKVLNFLSRPPSAILALYQLGERSEFAKCRIRVFRFDARGICRKTKIILRERPPQPARFFHGAISREIFRRRASLRDARGVLRPTVAAGRASERPKPGLGFLF